MYGKGERMLDPCRWAATSTYPIHYSLKGKERMKDGMLNFHFFIGGSYHTSRSSFVPAKINIKCEICAYS